MTIRALVIDDEPLARRRLQRALAQIDGVELVGEAGNIREAAAAIAASRPNLLLLDIQMPNGTGFDLIDRLGEPLPAIIFVTAFDEYAVAAFEARAIDYVLKPVAFERIAEAVERARRALRAHEQDQRLAELQEIVATLRAELVRRDEKALTFWVNSRGQSHRISASDIVWIEAERDYARIHTESRSWLYHESLSSLAERLDPRSFVRVHRSAIIRRDRITAYQRGAFASLTALLDNGAEVRVGRTYERQIRHELKEQQAAG
ncbi:response regulator [Sphingomonas sp. ID1715]|uniref:LytR/AlgR family response regulator transcription factor n=1 Tax=Sphingomonas sp. ID1715 TaxID=1656898 RepID=UPI001487F009|nr:response regulator [Sphingomonas sp. ID1715]NNM76237.1 response regulator [Sphingomonas sp. ID1715]